MFKRLKIVLCSIRCPALVVLFGAVVLADAQDKRAYRMDDLLAGEGLSNMSFSPDGHALAFERVRSQLSTPPALQNGFVTYKVRSDVWVQAAAGQAPRNLTKGETDATGAWEPNWSPDGARLAFISTRGGGVSLWVWEQANDKIRRIDSPGIRYNEYRNQRTCRWVDARRILCIVEPDGGKARLETPAGKAARMATEAWTRAAKGEQTASVLKSTEFPFQSRRLWLVDVESNTGRSVGTGVDFSDEVTNPTLWLSPDARTIAMVRPIPLPYNIASRQRMGKPVPLELARIDGIKIRLVQSLPENIHSANLQWSPDGKELAFFANGPGAVDTVSLYGAAAAATMPVDDIAAPGNPAKFYRVNIEKGTVTKWGTGEIDLGELGSPRFFWTAAGEIVVSAPRRRYGMTSGAPASRGAPWGAGTGNALPLRTPIPSYWWVIDRRGETRPLVPENTPLPASLMPGDGGAVFVGLRDGDVWRVDPNTGAVTNLTATVDKRVVSIEPGTKSAGVSGYSVVEESPPSDSSIFFRTDDGYSRIDLKTSAITELPNAMNSRLVAFSSKTNSAAYLTRERRIPGTFLWRMEKGSRKPELLVETNIHERSIEPPNCRLISYTSMNGEPLKARLCWPKNHVEGRRYPTVVQVYPGQILQDDQPDLDDELVTSAGYAYLKPSIPMRVRGTHPEDGNEPIMAINGILPAVEAAVSLRMADPGRLFIKGASQGGWTVLSTIGQTNRFKAAVSQSFVDDSGYGTLYAHTLFGRYDEASANQYVDPSGGFRKSVRPSDVPWWRDEHFRRNDPLTYVDRVQTPVMLIHGDLDPAPFEASERYFTALVSMRKPAEFVRYWGEGHWNVSSANIRDEWMRIFEWFDRWGDIARDEKGNMIWDGDHVKGRNGAPPLKPEDYAKFDLFQPSSARPRTVATSENKER